MILEKTKINNLQENNLEKNIDEEQTKFLETALGKVTNTALDVGLKMVLPDFIEDEVIKVKDTIMNNGFKEGIKQAIDSAINLGKNIKNIATGDFKDMSQVNDTIKKGGLLDKISDALSEVLKITKNKKLIDQKTTKKIEEGKDTILDVISSNLEKEFSEQLKSGKKIEKYIENWKKYYSEEDFKKMEKELTKIEKEIEKVMPFENIQKEIENIKNIENLIRSKNGEFDLSPTERDLINKLNNK